MQDAYDEDFLIEQLIEFTRELGRFPTEGELRWVELASLYAASFA
jgi:hypothetical protein